MRVEWSEAEVSVVNALQGGLPLVPYPFEEIGRRYGLSGEDVLALVRKLKVEGSCRRVGAIFDARRLGYRSVLCAALAPISELDRCAALASACPGVTHCYERGWPAELPPDSPGAPRGRIWPNLWFTLATPAEAFDAEIERLQAAFGSVEIHALPSLRRFKIDVVFDLRTRTRDEKTEPPTRRSPKPISDDGSVFAVTDAEREIIRSMQGDMAVEARFFAPVAAKVGRSETQLLDTLRTWQENGVLRRVALILRHRQVGFKANGMCAWDVAENETVVKGRALAQYPEITHCYERPHSPLFPFRLYAMIHTTSFLGTQQLFGRISRETGLQNGQLLLSLREYKKTSMVF
ncbi:MAG: hypothetical protein IJR99_01075 [Kiritimatiellae bacterium]|nr:hypothetical protein [Kiritimatiellia bacterium]